MSDEDVDWFQESEVAASDMSVSDFDALCSRAFEQRKKIDGMKEELKQEQEEMRKLESKILAQMELWDKKNYSCPFGKVQVSNKFVVPVPKSEEAKRLLFEEFKRRGIFYQYATVNSNSLNSWYKQELEEAQRNGIAALDIPGLESPTHISILSFRKG